jgi:hypothetical protein
MSNEPVRKLEQMALGLATSQHISSDNGYEGTWYETYRYLSDCVSEGKEPEDWAAYQPFEDYEWDQILEEIRNEASLILTKLEEALEYAKRGIVASAINCTLNDDMTQLDMESMVELGSQESI